ncbi:MAG: type II toxin-antitoxin system VapC family toxin [Candidatus Omnitrophica bacterium]|nr:type II toxin-antitoxin system VapC family toxin [Candidatus Omnitrophota bacterium]
MKAFIDTSAMLKRYFDEPGADAFDQFIRNVTHITVAPTYLLEAHAALERRHRDKTFTKEQVRRLKEKIEEDFFSYHEIEFNSQLCETAKYLIASYPMVTLDSIQLAAAMIANTQAFLTSDKQLFKYAQEELKNVELI